jgi:hypothetical protein
MMSAAAESPSGRASAEFTEYKRLSSKKLSVWAFPIRSFNTLMDLARVASGRTLFPGRPTIEKVTAPHAQNPNLHGQDGVFTVVVSDLADGPRGPVDRTTFDDAVGRAVADLEKDLSIPQLFYKVTLPWSEAGEVLNLLRIEGVSAATMFPGYKGVAVAMQEEWRAASHID